MVEHCLDDDFATFLDPGQCEPLSRDKADQINHRFYLETFNLVSVFNHHRMPKQMPHFVRAVDRFRTAPRPVFIHIVRQEPDGELLARLRTKLRGALLVYIVDPKIPQPGFRDSGGVTMFKSAAKFTPYGFQDSLDDAQFSARLLGDLSRFIDAAAAAVTPGATAG